jgi:alpha-beta hydrolase superfamily lysophospholipase
MFVMAYPDKVDRYIAYAQMGVDSVDIAKRKQNLKLYRDNAYIQIPELGWHGRFYSLTPKSANFPEVVDAYAKAAAAVEINTPTSPQLDLVTLLPMLNPKIITVPTMIIHGQFDDVADTKQLLPFFDQLVNPNKRYVVIPNAGHMMMYQQGYRSFQRVVIDYLKEQF